MREHILNDIPDEFFPPKRKPVDVKGKWRDNGVPVLSGGDVTTPIELLCGARSMAEFFLDLIEIPDKIEAVMDAIVPHLASKAIRRAKNLAIPLYGSAAGGPLPACYPLPCGIGSYGPIFENWSMKSSTPASSRCSILIRTGPVNLTDSKNFPGANASWPLMGKPIFSRPNAYWKIICASWAMSRRPCCICRHRRKFTRIVRN